MDEPQYKDDDLVYVDPRNRTIIGKVEWSNNGRPKSLAMSDENDSDAHQKPAGSDGDEKSRRPRRARYYPWGTYRSMRKLFKVGDWKPAEDNYITLDEAIEKALKDPYWN